jgi:hypothetical protein
VVLDETEEVGGGESGQIRIRLVGEAVLGTRASRFEEIVSSRGDAGRAAMPQKELGMNRVQVQVPGLMETVPTVDVGGAP